MSFLINNTFNVLNIIFYFLNLCIYIDEDIVNKNMSENNKKIPRMLLTLSVAILAISLLLLSLAPIVNVKATATDTVVTRTPSTTTPIPGSTFEIMLNITGLQIGGIIETIPDGFAFISTMHPSNQTYVSGQKIVFAVVNEAVIKYRVKAPLQGSGTFNGKWYDALNETEGDIGSTSISVQVAETPKPSPAVTPTPIPSPPTPGFEAVFTLAGLFAVAILFLLKRKGGKESE
ncbi:MAG TPA: hypothetical protein C5S37_07400 [Methanophagales archaeon]|nr:hypothetical protein [Methanophagales archaeon]